MSMAQQVYERVEVLASQGTTKADAFATLARELEKTPDAVRAAYYSARRAAADPANTGAGAPRRRHRETSAEDAITAAVASLEKSIAMIEREVAEAAERAEEASREHVALRDTAGAKIEAIQAKIAALAGE